MKGECISHRGPFFLQSLKVPCLPLKKSIDPAKYAQVTLAFSCSSTIALLPSQTFIHITVSLKHIAPAFIFAAALCFAFSCPLTSTSQVTNVHSLFEIYGSSIHICCFVLRTQVRFPLKVTQPKSWEAKARRVAGSPKPSFPANLGELWSLECVQDLGLEQEIL